MSCTPTYMIIYHVPLTRSEIVSTFCGPLRAAVAPVDRIYNPANIKPETRPRHHIMRRPHHSAAADGNVPAQAWRSNISRT